MENKYVDLTWRVVHEHCACLVFKDGNPLNVDDRVAFIEKTPRIFDGTNWIGGSKGEDGFTQESRDWCEQEIRKIYKVYPKEWSMDAILWGSGIEQSGDNFITEEEEEVYKLIKEYKYTFEFVMKNINNIPAYKNMYLTSFAIRLATVEQDDEYNVVCDGETESCAQLTQAILVKAFPSIRYYSKHEFTHIEWYSKIKRNLDRFPNYSSDSIFDTIICPDLFMHESFYAWEAYEILMAYCNSVSTVAYTREEADLL